MKRHNPHEQFFLNTFGNVETMRSFLKGTLPQKLLDLIDVSHIEYIKETQIDTKLHKNISDLVVKTSLIESSEPVDIYFLFEHKSAYDDKILFQILRYMLTIWEKDLKEKKKPRIIIPFIFYHGETRWKLRKLSELLTENPELKKFMPDIPYLIFDTADFGIEKSVKDFSDSIRLRLSLEMLKKAFIKSRSEVKELLEIIAQSGILDNEKEAEQFMFYFFKISDLETEEFMSIISNDLRINRKSGVKMVSLYDRMIQEGALKNAVETCKKALLAGAPIEFIIQITGLPLEKVLEIQKTIHTGQ